MKWGLLQLLTVFVIVIIMWMSNYISQNRAIPNAAGEWTAVNSPYTVFLVITLILGCFFLLFVFEARKENSFFTHPLWHKGPVLIGIIGFVSIVLFLAGGTFGPLMLWTAQIPALIYSFFIYFLFVIFIFIFAIQHKRNSFQQPFEKTIYISSLWTLGLFFGVFFLL
ncbi:hypothetical protein [Alkalicoccus daliensis]|uniref:Uncharacterized protein n=1 Tax=Alkalicoccus daliensis TaxID=745820 RepID=A0A1H0CZA5_9BACI|nr:hypothetical protein [Alkalicoccus daliensis]SDN63240.1 hypothetical protein SAMN04488053_102286 [Alkalicoccus daliensis]